MSNYEVQLMKRASRRLLGDNPNRKSPVTINMLIGIHRFLGLSLPFRAAVWALLLVAFFSLLRKSNLLPATYQQGIIATRRINVVVTLKGLFYQCTNKTYTIQATSTNYSFTKNIQFHL